MRPLLSSILLFAALSGCGGGVDWFPDNQVSTSSVSISTKSVPAATVATPYSQSLVAVGGTPPYSWTITSGELPPGLSMNGAGVITGTPTTAGSYVFTVQVSDSTATPLTATQELTIFVSLPATLGAGQTAVLRSNDTIKVPPGTTISTTDGKVSTVVGNNGHLITSPGAVLAVPSDATGTADNVVIASL